MPPEQWPFQVLIDSSRPNVMYAATKNGKNAGFCDRNDFCGVMLKSEDGGETWREIMDGLDPWAEYYSIVLHPRNPDVVFASSSKGVWVSEDAGSSWRSFNNGLPVTFNFVRDNVAQNLKLSTDGRHLLLGLGFYGVWAADLTGTEPE